MLFRFLCITDFLGVGVVIHRRIVVGRNFLCDDLQVSGTIYIMLAYQQFIHRTFIQFNVYLKAQHIYSRHLYCILS